MVKYTLKNEPYKLHLCHCTQCQKHTGSAFAANIPVPPDHLSWTQGEQHLKRYDMPGRSFTNIFCNECGNRMPFLNVSGTTVFVTAGSLDDEPDLSESNQIFCIEKPDWSITAMQAEEHSGFKVD